MTQKLIELVSCLKNYRTGSGHYFVRCTMPYNVRHACMTIKMLYIYWNRTLYVSKIVTCTPYNIISYKTLAVYLQHSLCRHLHNALLWFWHINSRTKFRTQFQNGAMLGNGSGLTSLGNLLSIIQCEKRSIFCEQICSDNV